MNQDHLIGDFNIPLSITAMFNDGVIMNVGLNLKVLLDNFDLFKEKTKHDPIHLSPEMVSIHFSRKRDLINPLRIIALEYDSADPELIDKLKQRVTEVFTDILSKNGIKLIRLDKLNLLVSDNRIENNTPQKQVIIVRQTNKTAVIMLSILLIIVAAAFAIYYLQTSAALLQKNSTIRLNDLKISSLESDVDSLNIRIKSLLVNVDDLNLEKSDLNTQLVSIHEELSSLDDKYSSLETDNRSLSRELDQLESEFNETEDELDLYKDTYGSIVASGIQPPFGWYINRLHNDSSAIDPTYNELMSFLRSDKVDQNIYVVNKYMCGHFASDLHNNAEASGYRAAFVAIDFKNQTEMHACNVFKTTDRGLVFIDVTGRQLGDIKISSYDKIVDVEIGNKYIPKSLFPDSNWQLNYNSMGTVDDVMIYW